MAIVPLRDFGKLGVITDVDPYDLPLNAFSFAKNVRFEDGKVQRGSVFRSVGPLSSTPVHLIGYQDQNGNDTNLYHSYDGFLRVYPGNASVSPASWTAVDADAPVTSCILQNVVYVNRPDRLPWYRNKDSVGLFAPIPSAVSPGWDPTWRCEALRTVAGVLVALNMTKGPASYPTMVKWSNFATYGNVVPDWDFASPTSSAGENTLADMQGAIIDGFPMRNRLYLYGRDETRYMEYIGGNDMFRFERAFDKGVINANCVVEDSNLHYVFGDNDIWYHDGVSEKSLATGRVRRFIYRTMDKNKSSRFFVTQNKRQNEIIFCYVSNDAYISFSSTTIGCNRAAIYNTASQTWSFHDMPVVTCAGLLQPTLGTTFDGSAPTSWESVGGSWSSTGGDDQYNVVFGNCTDGVLPVALRSFASFTSTSTTQALDDAANRGAYLERLGIDLDELKASLRGYKLVSSIYPQGRLDPDAQPITFTFGIADHPNEVPYWGIPQTYDSTWYKLDFNQAGRFLAMKAEQLTDYRDFSLMGMDADLMVLGDF
jgi:hypothetical protein